MSESPLVSVVMPVYNGGAYLKSALESILNQTYREFELIVIDDGSSDGSWDVISACAARDPRVVPVRQKNGGRIAAQNAAIAMAKGKYLARMDHDDLSEPERFREQVELLERENADICGCHWVVVDEQNKIIETVTVPLSAESFVLALSQTVPFAHGSVMMRRGFLAAHDLTYRAEPYPYADDYDLWLRMFDAGAKFANVDRFLFKYRILSGSFSHKNLVRNISDAQKLSIGFIRDHFALCEKSLDALLGQSLSILEQEQLFLLGLRMSVRSRRTSYFLSGVRKIEKRNLPKLLVRAAFNVFRLRSL
jgi:glycosyltransferase involved in cell wall biosynthesis